MANRGRPAKVFSASDLDNLRLFLQQQHFLKKNEEKALSLLQNQTENFDDQQLKILKLADREKTLFQQKQTLLQQIKIKEKNQQKLLENEAEILTLAHQEQDRDTYFRLDRALESYQKIQKAVLNDRIRLENEHRRDVLQKTGKTITEAQKRRNEENRRKYELGGAVLSAFKKLNIDIDSISPEKVHNRIVNNLQFASKVRSTKVFQQVAEQQANFFKRQDLFIDVINRLVKWKIQDESLVQKAIKEYKDKYDQ